MKKKTIILNLKQKSGDIEPCEVSGFEPVPGVFVHLSVMSFEDGKVKNYQKNAVAVTHMASSGSMGTAYYAGIKEICARVKEHMTGLDWSVSAEEITGGQEYVKACSLVIFGTV